MTSLSHYAAFPPSDNLLFDWEHRSRDIPPNLLHAGGNTVRIVMSGDTVMDRLQLEFMHAN